MMNGGYTPLVVGCTAAGEVTSVVSGRFLMGCNRDDAHELLGVP